MTKTKICCIFNYAPHYRAPIYEKIDNELNSDFYFGDKLNGTEIKKLNFAKLKGFKRELEVTFHEKYEYTKGWSHLALKKEYRKYIITPNYTAINQWLFLIICKILNKRVYSWMHGIKTAKISKKFLFLAKAYDRFLSGSFIYGNYARNNMINLGFKSEKLHVIHNSLNYEEQLKIRSSFQSSDIYRTMFNNENRTLIFIGRLTKVKNLGLILDAIKLLQAKEEYYNLILVGDGPLHNDLVEKANDLDLKDSVIFYGESYDERVNGELIYNADLCVSPGNVGLTSIHSLTFGTPVLTNDDFDSQMPEFEAINIGKTGDFFEKDSASDLANKISLWFKNNGDKREIVRQNCYKEIEENWTPEFQIKVIKSVLR